MTYEMNHDDMCAFARVMYDTQWKYDGEDGGECVLAFFEAPHKWDAEYQKWRELGGSLDKECVKAFDDWYDHKDEPEDDDD